jgi:hypothetical protein
MVISKCHVERRNSVSIVSGLCGGQQRNNNLILAEQEIFLLSIIPNPPLPNPEISCGDVKWLGHEATVKFTLEQAMKAQRGNRGCTLSLTSELDGGVWSLLCTGCFIPG